MDKKRIDRRAYIVSDSIMSPLGLGTDKNMREVFLYNSGIKRISDSTIYHLPFMAAKIEEEYLLPESNRWLDDIPDDLTLLERRVLITVIDALDSIKLTDTKDFIDDTCLIVATTKANIDHLRPISDEMESVVFPGIFAQRIADALGIKNSPVVISTACISGVNALVLGSRAIESNRYSNVIVVGADLLSAFVVTGFESFKSISSDRCKPYDSTRDGLNLGEAVGVAVLSSSGELCKDANPVVIEGGAITGDANHLSAPSRTGDGLGESMLGAMRSAGVKAGDISFINAHGTSTIYNDEMESKAVHYASLESIEVQSLKPYFGHTLGASGVIESIASAWQLKNSILFGTLGYNTPGVSMDIKVSPFHNERRMCRVLKSASGFGGCNASIVMALDSCRVEKYIDLTVGWQEISSIRYKGDSQFDEFIKERYKELNIKDIKFFKMDRMSRLGVIGSYDLLKGVDMTQFPDPFDRAIILANSSSSLDTDLKHQLLIEDNSDNGASPAVFVYTLPNIAIGEISIRQRFKGENNFLLYGEDRAETIHSELLELLNETTVNLVICGWCDYLNGRYELNLKLYKRQKNGE